MNTKAISCTDLTIPFLFQLTELMTGVYDDISSFQIIDCRYPYEFEGGHIQVLTCFLRNYKIYITVIHFLIN